MDNTFETKKEGSNLRRFFSLLALIVVGFGAWFLWKEKKVEPSLQNIPEIIPPTNQKPSLDENTSSYKDGTYSSLGSYVSPGGFESISVKVVLSNGKIIDSSVVPQADRRESKQWQEIFTANYKSYVIGKNIDEIQLDNISGSSLTTKGFNDAIKKIKEEAKI